MHDILGYGSYNSEAPKFIDISIWFLVLEFSFVTYYIFEGQY